MNVEFLARLQFAFTIAFHYIYPPLSIGLGVRCFADRNSSLFKARTKKL